MDTGSVNDYCTNCPFNKNKEIVTKINNDEFEDDSNELTKLFTEDKQPKKKNKVANIIFSIISNLVIIVLILSIIITVIIVINIDEVKMNNQLNLALVYDLLERYVKDFLNII